MDVAEINLDESKEKVHASAFTPPLCPGYPGYVKAFIGTLLVF